MKIEILTIFPGFYQQFLETSIIHRAIRDHKVEIHIHDLRDYAHNKHRQIDDTPYGGGVGMLMQFPPIDRKSTRLNSSHPSRSRMPSSA